VEEIRNVSLVEILVALHKIAFFNFRNYECVNYTVLILLLSMYLIKLSNQSINQTD
jgi:hypothetical protein